MKRALYAVLAIALAAPAHAQDGATTPQVVLRHVTLQIEREPDYSANEVMKLLGTPAYLGSIARNLVPKDVDGTFAAWTMASDPSHTPLVYVGCAMPTSEIVAVTFSGTSMDAIERGRDAVIAHLASIVPPARASRELERKSVVEAEDLARKRLARARESSQEFTNQFGDDLDARLGTLRNRRTELARRATSLEQDLATSTATRDYLKQWIDTTRVTVPAPSGNSVEMAQVHEDLEEAEKQFAQMKTEKKPEHPDMVKVTRLIQELKSKVRSQETNSKLADAESRLFRYEEEIFAMTREREWIAGELAKLGVEEKEANSRASKGRLLNDELRRASDEFEIASNRKRVSDQEWSRISGEAWIRVLAAP